MSIGRSDLGNVLVIAGAVVGAGAVTALALGFSPHLSEYMVNLLFYKGLGAMAIGLIIAGAWVGRAARRAAQDGSSGDSLAGQRLDSDATRHLLEDASLPFPLDGTQSRDSAKLSVRNEQRAD